jgi:dipeptidase
MKQFILLIIAFFQVFGGLACTNILVTKGASADKATYLVYLNDGEWLYHLNTTPAADHDVTDSLNFTSLSGKKYKIHQVAHTYAIVGFQINEHQLAIGETTFTGRKSLWDKNKPLKYWDLMRLALLRARTAREAIGVITSLVEKYGYGSEGETFSIADPNEAWLLEMVGTGGEGGAVWVARRVPDGMITAHANHSRISTFPLDDPENCLYSKNVISYAIQKGFYNPKSGKAFAFNNAYDPPSPEHLKYTETRVWSIFRRAAPSQNFSMDYHRGIKGAKPYPLFIKPDKKLKLKNIFALVRDHYEGTALDMTRLPEAGPFGNPNRVRPLDWQTDTADYSWERPISTYNTAFSFVAQLRGYLPDNIGGLIWFGEDDTYTNCYFPIYCSVSDVAAPYKTGDINHYSPKSAWWAFNLVANYANIRYQDMVEDIRKVQSELENSMISRQDSIEKIALSKQGNEQIAFLTDYSMKAGMEVYQRWLALANQLITKYNDGYIKRKGHIEAAPYPQAWRDFIIRQHSEKHKIRKWHNETLMKDKPF